MPTGTFCEKAESGACSCAIADRMAAYQSLATLFQSDGTRALDAIRRLRPAIHICGSISYIDDDAVTSGFDQAIAALEADGGANSFEEEGLRLFGDCEGFDPFSHELSASEMTYVAFEPLAHAERLRAGYAANGYDMGSDWSGNRCPGHIAVELGYMAHCMREGMAGSDSHMDEARRFFAEHLSEWAVLFAVVTANKARHPVMRLAGLALDKFLACEATTFRHAIPSLCMLRHSASA